MLLAALLLTQSFPNLGRIYEPSRLWTDGTLALTRPDGSIEIGTTASLKPVARPAPIRLSRHAPGVWLLTETSPTISCTSLLPPSPPRTVTATSIALAEAAYLVTWRGESAFLTSSRQVKLKTGTSQEILPRDLSPQGFVCGSLARQSPKGSIQLPAVWNQNGQLKLLKLPAGYLHGAAELISADGRTVAGRVSKSNPVQAVNWMGPREVMGMSWSPCVWHDGKPKLIEEKTLTKRAKHHTFAFLARDMTRKGKVLWNVMLRIEGKSLTSLWAITEPKSTAMKEIRAWDPPAQCHSLDDHDRLLISDPSSFGSIIDLKDAFQRP